MKQLNPQTGCGHGLTLATGLLLALASAASAAEFIQTAPTAGGVSPLPTITSVTRTNTNLTIKWNGFEGPYVLQRKASVTDVWHPHGNFSGSSATVPATDELALFQIAGPTPTFEGVQICELCHDEIAAEWGHTGHAKAFQTLKDYGVDTNPYCQKCHTVGQGFSTGFTSEAQTPHLAGVQCENCHGPGATHLANPLTPALRPVKSADSMICGGCHDGFHHPTYSEWKQAGHAEVTESIAEEILAASDGGVARMKSCGACHSGSARLAMLAAWEKDGTNGVPVMPSAKEGAEVAITCVVCHSPHAETANPYQLRNPEFSNIPFTYSTATSTTFGKQYNPNVQICGQCHNNRGAVYTSNARPPHHSPQYNIMIGQGGVTNNVPFFNGKHAEIEKQCASCHTHPIEQASPSPVNPNYKGHQFRPTTDSCLDCHSSTITNALLQQTHTFITQQIGFTKSLLDTWAVTKAPAITNAFATYGKLAWEYTSVGQLSNPDGTPGVVGPPSALQSKLPVNIQQARFNLYLVEHDASKGIHNPPYIRYLLSVAQEKATTELNK